MKIGSVVMCINPEKVNHKYIKGNTPYTVREIITKGQIISHTKSHTLLAGENGIRLEEVIMPDVIIGDCIIESPIPMKYFRELLPNVKQEVEEILNKQFQTV